MPSFFAFQQGSESRGSTNDSSPLLGRFRAVPNSQRNGRRSHRNSLLGSWAGGTYNAILGLGSEDDFSAQDDLPDGEEAGVLRRWVQRLRDLWLEPKQAVVGRAVNKWWSRWSLLMGLPAVLVSALQLLSIVHLQGAVN